MAAYYDKFQLVTYLVPTDHPLDAGELCVPETDLKDVADQLAELSADALRRLKRLIAVAEKALKAQGLEDKDRPNTLKIFMAPEFYFRPKSDGPQRSYTEAEMKALLAVLKFVFAQKKFDNWLLVLGTIIWHQPASVILDSPEVKQTLKLDDPKLEAARAKPIVWNTLVIAKGYDQNETLTTFSKLFYASADDIHPQYQPMMNVGNEGQTLYDALDPDNVKTLKTYFEQTREKVWTDCFIKVGTNNLWFAVEICMDHDVGVVKKAFFAFKRKINNNKATLDFQLLTACGMRVHPENLKLEKERFIMRVDGASMLDDSWVDPFHFSEIQQFLGTVKVNNKSLGPCTTTAYIDPKRPNDSKNQWAALNKTTVTALDDALVMDVGNLQGAYFESQERKRPYVKDWYKQQLVIYAPQAFAHVAAAQNPQ